ncbi:hypothetical protein FKP32DRAFT_1611112 [Trametes sanguinea]|nr:hypothetical protein FKP32DRAFT_1611112 [Trametes sanguinea]
MEGQLQKMKEDNASLHQIVQSLRAQLRSDRQKLSRSRKTTSKLRERLCSSKKERIQLLKRQQSVRTTTEKASMRTTEDAKAAFSRLYNVNEELKKSLSTCQKNLRNCKRRITRVPRQMDNLTKKLRSRPLIMKLMVKGVYTMRARAFARLLVRVQVLGKMDSHTVQRVVLEGGYASDLQLAYELHGASNFTISGDATMNRCINYEARHIHVPNKLEPSHIQTRLLGVESSINHTSESQLDGWTTCLESLAGTFNKSPLALRDKVTISAEDCTVKLAGMGGDHAADQIKTHGLLACWKKEMTYHFFARNHLGAENDAAASALETLVMDASHAAVETSGGVAAWQGLSPKAQMTAYINSFSTATMTLGKALYEGLPAEERRPLDLFLRLGCTMHKDLNSVKGGNAAMAAAWGELHTAPPILLANKENASTLREVDLDDLTAAELCALESSTRGGIQLTSLAGALFSNIFNHKDEKKGHHDTYVFFFWETVGQPLRFPDTSNTCFSSHCTAATELLVHRMDYIRFLEVVRYRKEPPGFNNMEENVYKGLHDIPVLTELAAISHPYLRTTRLLQNGLKLGPFHQNLKDHLRNLIDRPELLLSPDMTSNTAALDGKEWERCEVIDAVLALAPELPHLRDVLRTFLDGLLHTWERFTAEFAEGEELDRVYLLPTNDHNEGALGLYRIWSRRFPNGSQAYYNALAKFLKNNTAQFMEMHLSATSPEHPSLLGQHQELEANQL